MNDNTTNQPESLNEWLSRVRSSHFAHNLAAATFERLHRRLGGSSVILSAIVGTTVFATITESPNIYIKTLVGLSSIIAAALTAFLTFSGYSELASKHKKAAIDYGELRNELEWIRDFSSSNDKMSEVLESFPVRWKKLNGESPLLSQQVLDRTERRIKASQTKTAKANANVGQSH